MKDENDRKIVARITARYCNREGASDVRIRYEKEGEGGNVWVLPISDSVLEKWRV